MWSRLWHRARLAFGSPVDPAQLRAPFVPATWCLDRATVSDSQMVVGGWAIHVDGRPLGMAINGRRFERESMALARPDIVPLFAHVTDASHTGFECHASLTPRELSGDDPIAIRCVDPATLVPFREQQTFYVPPPSVERWSLPDPARMRRVHGSTDGDSFRLVGYSNFKKLDYALRQVTGAGFEDRQTVLDWGCGCGRLLRYMDRVPRVSLTGVDIDADNVGWCQAHLPFASYQAIPLHPPTQLPSEAFDTLVGISVFTHLTEPTQYEWLGELQRIARPGAVLLMTIHGPAVTAMGGNSALWSLVQDRGFVDGASGDLDDVLADKSYYRNSFHTHEYIRRNWTRYFDVLEIVPACVGNMQDLVIMRARGGR